jgi:hypothetical protein
MLRRTLLASASAMALTGAALAADLTAAPAGLQLGWSLCWRERRRRYPL